ncbi:MAG TPA: insulinase family protein [Bacteroidetes bacterium]|nr:insulinase family protein [Bacteroidota bacterium]
MEIIRHELKNGIRMVHSPLPTGIGYCGLLFNTGSRDERDDETGMAHFIEHVLFKGTGKRKAWHILSRMEDVGGELNAYTTKEETFLYASFLKEDYPRAMELLADIAFRSTFPENEIEREKEVVLEEINSYLDSPGELIYDEFENMIFPGQPLGRFILGKPEDVKNITRDKIVRFYEDNYATDEIVFCSAGNIPEKKIKNLFETYFSDIPYKARRHPRAPVTGYLRSERKEKKDTCQSHCIIGTKGYKVTDKKRTGLYLLNNILGGQGLNSRLNITLREKRGLAYLVESSYNPYMDTGVFSIYFGTDRKDLDKSIHLTLNELKKLREKPLGPMQLQRARKQLSGQLIRSVENPENLIANMGRTLLVFQKTFDLQEMLKAIDDLTSEDIYTIANEILDPATLSSLIFY